MESMLPNSTASSYVSLGIFAWNEEASIGATLETVFRQSLFSELARRGHSAEVICVVNGCTDRTPDVVEQIFERQRREHAARGNLICRVVNLVQRGKLNAWNQYVHTLSASAAQFLFLMDSDILIHREGTLCQMLTTLEKAPEASVTVDHPRKDLEFQKRQSWKHRLSLRTGDVTGSGEAQLCAQLYCIRAKIARQIYLPKDLPACDDGYIKALVCTDFLAHEVKPERIKIAEQAEHTFEAYTSLNAILRNQKRQIIGQTIVHILIDQYLASFAPPERERLGELLRDNDRTDPFWLKQLIAEHLRRTRFFWRLYPDLLTHRLQRLSKLTPKQRLACLPASLAGIFITGFCAWLAHRALKAGATDYWPKAARRKVESGPEVSPTIAPLGIGNLK